jgi:hypothetical protein
MPLNKKMLKAHVHCNDSDGRGHWVESNGDWMALLMNNGLLKIRHMYREVTLPPITGSYWSFPQVSNMHVFLQAV